MYPRPVALELYSIREDLAKNFEAGLRKVAEIGYAGVEPAGFPGTTPHAAGRLFHKFSLAVPSAHSALPIGDKKNQVLDAMNAIGCQRIIAGSLPEALFQSLEGIYEAADRLNAAAAVARERGLKVGYHNHRQEFTLVEGRPAYEHMLPRLVPDVLWEVDTYWAQVAEHDPAEVIAKLGPRATLLHIKDGPGTVRDPMTAVGDGVMNWPHVMAAGEAHAEWLIVEIDRTAGDMMKALEKSYRYLVDKGWGHGAAYSRA